MLPRNVIACLWVVACVCGASGFSHAQIPAAADILERYRPLQPVDVDTPDKAEWGKCKNEVARIGKGSGFVVTGPQGQVLRRFVDLDGNQSVDQYRYYKDGIEVYREIDTTGNPKAPAIDQFRWFNTGGTRWGVDSNKDGVIDQWKIISAEEVSMEAIRALATGDARFLMPLLATPDDLTAIGVEKSAQAEILKPLENAEKGLLDIIKQSKSIKKSTRWMQFNCAMPYMVPAEPGKSTQDLYLYENAIAIIQNGNETGSVHLGEIVRIGNTWKLTVLPRPVEGQESFVAEGGRLFQPNLAMNSAAPNTPDGGLNPEVQKLVDGIKKLDEAMPGPDAKPAEIQKYNATRFQYIAKLADLSATPEEQDSWRRQLIEGIYAATQMGHYPDGLSELERLEAQYAKTAKDEPVYPFTVFRRILTAYMFNLQKAEVNDRQKIQEELMKSLEDFARTFPQADDRPDALLQIAITHDLIAKAPEAMKWYAMIAKEHPQSRAGAQAKGAIRRLGLKGQKFELAGNLLGGGQVDVAKYKGKVLVVTYWTTYCTDCTRELPMLIEMYAANRAAGMEVLGVNADVESAPIKEHIQQHKVPWPHIFEPGGMEGAPIMSYGIVTLPTTIIVDKNGTVAAVTNSMEDVKKLVPELLKK